MSYIHEHKTRFPVAAALPLAGRESGLIEQADEPGRQSHRVVGHHFRLGQVSPAEGAIKWHLLLDHNGYLPSFAVVTDGKYSELKVARGLSLEAGTILAIDRGYNDYGWFEQLTRDGVFFVTRMKTNTVYTTVEVCAVPAKGNVLSDEIVSLPALNKDGETPVLFRRIGFRCPRCKGNKGWRTIDGRWSCSGCGRKVSVTAGTIFDRSRIPLQQWFAAAWYITNQKQGVSALGLQRLLGLGSYQTAWTILQKLRTAMIRPDRDRLCGSVEVDETYVGGIAQGVRGRGADCKFIVAIAIEVLAPRGFGRVRLQHVNDVSGASLIPFVSGAVEAGSEVHTDGWKGYNGLSRRGYIYHATSISKSGDPAP